VIVLIALKPGVTENGVEEVDLLFLTMDASFQEDHHSRTQYYSCFQEGDFVLSLCSSTFLFRHIGKAMHIKFKPIFANYCLLVNESGSKSAVHAALRVPATTCCS
jgi:hypothetical protein